METFCKEYGLTLVKEYQAADIYNPDVIIASNTVLRNGSRITITKSK